MQECVCLLFVVSESRPTATPAFSRQSPRTEKIHILAKYEVTQKPTIPLCLESKALQDHTIFKHKYLFLKITLEYLIIAVDT
jgi:hypothetical protein